MEITSTFQLADANGAPHTFFVFSKWKEFQEIGAVYMFMKRNEYYDTRGNNIVLYIGKTENLKERISNHEKWPCVIKHGCTHIAYSRMPDENSRQQFEEYLINKFNPPCNLI